MYCKTRKNRDNILKTILFLNKRMLNSVMECKSTGIGSRCKWIVHLSRRHMKCFDLWRSWYPCSHMIGLGWLIFPCTPANPPVEIDTKWLCGVRSSWKLAGFRNEESKHSELWNQTLGILTCPVGGGWGLWKPWHRNPTNHCVTSVSIPLINLIPSSAPSRYPVAPLWYCLIYAFDVCM